MEKHVLLLTTLVMLTFITIVSLLVKESNNPHTFLSEAREQKAPLCPINTTFYVHEIDDKGQEIPLSFDKYPENDVLDWNISDGQSENSQPLYFNQSPLIKYTVTSEVLTFSALPLSSDIYNKGDITFLKLNYPTDKFHIIKKEILTCSSPRNTNLCNTRVSDSDEELNVIRDIALDCNMSLEAGWVVQKNLSASQQSVAPIIADCDLNDDGACNTFDLFLVLDDYGKEAPNLMGDLNKDGRVNALDYTLLTSSISHL